MIIPVFISYGSDGDELLDAQAHTNREEASGRIKTSYESYLADSSYDPEDTFCTETSAQVAFTDRSWIYLQVMESAIEIEGLMSIFPSERGVSEKGVSYA